MARNATALAREWESDALIRRRAFSLQAVVETGTSVCRDTVCQNERVLLLSYRHLGPRVSVETLDTHLTSLYNLVGLQVGGASIHMQSWTLRRCMSIFNTICSRPHMPRETPLRRLIQDLDIQLPSSSKASEESDGSSSGSDDENSPSDAEGSEVGGEENQDAEQEEQAGTFKETQEKLAVSFAQDHGKAKALENTHKVVGLVSHQETASTKLSDPAAENIDAAKKVSPDTPCDNLSLEQTPIASITQTQEPDKAVKELVIRPGTQDGLACAAEPALTTEKALAAETALTLEKASAAEPALTMEKAFAVEPALTLGKESVIRPRTHDGLVSAAEPAQTMEKVCATEPTLAKGKEDEQSRTRSVSGPLETPPKTACPDAREVQFKKDQLQMLLQQKRLVEVQKKLAELQVSRQRLRPFTADSVCCDNFETLPTWVDSAAASPTTEPAFSPARSCDDLLRQKTLRLDDDLMHEVNRPQKWECKLCKENEACWSCASMGLPSGSVPDNKQSQHQPDKENNSPTTLQKQPTTSAQSKQAPLHTLAESEQLHDERGHHNCDEARAKERTETEHLHNCDEAPAKEGTETEDEKGLHNCDEAPAKERTETDLHNCNEAPAKEGTETDLRNRDEAPAKEGTETEQSRHNCDEVPAQKATDTDQNDEQSLRNSAAKAAATPYTNTKDEHTPAHLDLDLGDLPDLWHTTEPITPAAQNAADGTEPKKRGRKPAAKKGETDPKPRAHKSKGNADQMGDQDAPATASESKPKQTRKAATEEDKENKVEKPRKPRNARKPTDDNGQPTRVKETKSEDDKLKTEEPPKPKRARKAKAEDDKRNKEQPMRDEQAEREDGNSANEEPRKQAGKAKTKHAKENHKEQAAHGGQAKSEENNCKSEEPAKPKRARKAKTEEQPGQAKSEENNLKSEEPAKPKRARKAKTEAQPPHDGQAKSEENDCKSEEPAKPKRARKAKTEEQPTHDGQARSEENNCKSEEPAKPKRARKPKTEHAKQNSKEQAKSEDDNKNNEEPPKPKRAKRDGQQSKESKEQPMQDEQATSEDGAQNEAFQDEAPRKEDNRDTEEGRRVTSRTVDHVAKARMSRKSSAYHRVRSELIRQGVAKEIALARAREAYKNAT